LSDPVTNRIGHRHMTATNKSKSDGRIQLPTRDVHGRGSERCDRESMRQGYGENVMPGGFDRTDANKNQRESSDKFCNAGTKFIHPVMQTKQALTDNVVLPAAEIGAQPPA
jgi:hypothetical protein